MSFICRFAPSPTGPLHIGGVRTALFNWLLAKKNKGKYFLRIEDTDKERSKEEFKEQIISSLQWLGIEHDGEPYIQSKNIERHVSVANELLTKGFAYPCYCTEQELEEQKSLAKKTESYSPVQSGHCTKATGNAEGKGKGESDDAGCQATKKIAAKGVQ